MLVVIIYLFLETPNRLASCSQTDICRGPQAGGLGRQARSRLPLRALGLLGAIRKPARRWAGPEFGNRPGDPTFSRVSSNRDKAQNDTVLAQDPQVGGFGRELMGREKLDIIKSLGRMCDPRVILAEVPLGL